MNYLLIYLIQSSVSLAVFIICYEILFRREVYFQFIRYYFLMAILVSVFLPLMNINISQTLAESYNVPMISAPVPNLVQFTLGEVTIHANSIEDSGMHWYNRFSIYELISYTYLIGVLISSLIFLLRLVQLSKLFLKYRKFLLDSLKIVAIPGIPSFSFFNYIFMDGNLVNNADKEKIIAHEKVHIEQKHSIDLILAEILVIVQWFNPFVYLLRNKIKENHEFIADNDVVGLYPDKLEYSRLLIENSSIIGTNILTHNFSYSLLKRRLFMIKRNKNPQLFALKMIGVVIAITLVAFACSGPVSNEAVVGTDADKTAMEPVFTKVETMPEYPGGMEKLVEYLADNIVYPEASSKNGIEGKVIVKFVVRNDGSISDVKVQEGVDELCDAEAVRVISSMPIWKPGMKDGKAVNVSYVLPIRFILDQKDTSDVFTVVETMPEFPGGSQKLMSYLGNNIKYPEKAKAEKVQGRVFVTFVIEKDGSVDNVSILRGIGSGCDEESLRVVSSMPNWTPGKQKGEPVRVQYNLPIKFKLD